MPTIVMLFRIFDLFIINVIKVQSQEGRNVRALIHKLFIA